MKASYQEIQDDQILALITNDQNSERGFRLLLEKYQERLYWQIRRMVIDHEDTNDVLQNCMVKVFKSIKRFEGKSQLYTWLYRIATNESITFLNKKQKKQATSLDDEMNHLENKLEADSYFDGSQAQILLKKAILTLPEKQRAVFNMRYFEEKSYQEISDILGTSVGGLKASFHHAVKKIEAYVKNVEAF